MRKDKEDIESLKAIRRKYGLKMLDGDLSPAHIRIRLKSDSTIENYVRSARAFQHFPWSYKLYKIPQTSEVAEIEDSE